jgi:hypothetical protein
MYPWQCKEDCPEYATRERYCGIHGRVDCDCLKDPIKAIKEHFKIDQPSPKKGIISRILEAIGI